MVAPVDDGFYLIGFSDCEVNAETYLTLQRALTFDEQDVAFGMDTYHVEWCSQERSSYGGISQFTLRPSSAEIAFSSSAARALGGMERLSISFQLTPFEQHALRDALGYIFGGDGCLVMADD
ncbi:Imm10 family immunity protein [Xanthomonas hortorum]|uniref:Imm10 family immunity protein n=1 Tax=Xanthomonas hortorum TaxID=56454 RepID=UPI002935C21B|nr:Imm10 family immunity protein [Xanthomonas hortorum]MDV2453156.1 Imm10 family immunity protein [Xanthomonas hortorum NBC5720]